MAKARRILAETEAEFGPQPAAPSLGDIVGSIKQGFADAVAASFDPRADVIDPGGADFRNPPPLVDDPSVAAAERTARDAARGPYLASPAPAVRFTRMPTTGDDQLADLASVLAGLRPERVFGVSRVPDRYDERRTREGKAYLEWEIVHAPDAAADGPERVDLTGFNRADLWARRDDGDPEVLDEDMVGVLVSRAGLAPEDCFGLTRLLELRVEGGGDSSSTHVAHVRGALAVSRRALLPVLQELAAEAPLEVGPPPFHVTVLDWEAIAAWNVPKRWYPPRVPAPLPHLFTSPQELLAAHLEVVGIAPQDCYGAMVTRDGDSSGLGDLGPAGISRDFRLPKHRCADGQERPRHSAAQHVVVAYRDTPAYAEGRGRWAAYEQEVLRARLSRPIERAPMRRREFHADPFVVEVLNMFNPLDPMPMGPTFRNRHTVTLGPYC